MYKIYNLSKKTSRGFTLIELLVVIAIVGILSSVVMASLSQSRLRGRDAMRVSQINAVQKALELYYLDFGEYPPNTAALDVSDNIPVNWANMLSVLNSNGLIRATISRNNILDRFGLITQLFEEKVAHASVAPSGPFYASIQDPLYNEPEDFLLSYGYVASLNRQNYKIRARLEVANSPMFNSSYSGRFLDSETTGESACDTSLRYYCVSK